MLKVNEEIGRSVVELPDKSVKSLLAFQLPPEITFPLEQSTILITDGMLKVAGVFPIAVTTKLKERVASTFDMNLTLVEPYILAPLPDIE